MARHPPAEVNTVVIGGGPSSLILSYVLHGHIPYYSGRHHDDLLDTKLRAQKNLLSITPEVYSHLQNSIRYSSQALPVNTLLDTLVRPNADTQVNPLSCVRWNHEPTKAISHVVLTGATTAGGQWAQKSTGGNDEIGALSYAEMLSLPGYSISDHYLRQYGSTLPEFQRPSRSQVASYYAAYPDAVGISSTLFTSTIVSGVMRTATGFHIGSANINCKNIVLATGIFNITTPHPPMLAPLKSINSQELPLLVIGSGFSAADAMISAPPDRKIIHIFQWNPEDKPSPLRACHRQAYPDYAGIYRQMKSAAALSPCSRSQLISPLMKKKGNPFFKRKDWLTVYEGLPNAVVESAEVFEGQARVTIRLEDGRVLVRDVGGLAYLVGRRGTLDYLDSSLRAEVLYNGTQSPEKAHADGLLTSRTLRAKAEADLEVAPHVFITGSLTGDSLVRHAFGACLYAAGKILGVQRQSRADQAVSSLRWGFAGTSDSGHSSRIMTNGSVTNGSAHADLHIDRRELLTGYSS